MLCAAENVADNVLVDEKNVVNNAKFIILTMIMMMVIIMIITDVNLKSVSSNHKRCLENKPSYSGVSLPH